MRDYIAETPQTYLFRYGTSYRDPAGIEWVIVAKSIADLEAAWKHTAANCVPFDAGKVSEVKINRAQ